MAEELLDPTDNAILGLLQGLAVERLDQFIQLRQEVRGRDASTNGREWIL